MTFQSEDDAMRLSFIRHIADNPLDETARLVFSDWLDEHGDQARAEILRAGNIPLTEIDEAAVAQLAGCAFSPATWPKRFARDIYSRTAEPNPCLTPKQYLWLWVLLRRYRRSVRDPGIAKIAEERYKRYIDMLNGKLLKESEQVEAKMQELWKDINPG